MTTMKCAKCATQAATCCAANPATWCTTPTVFDRQSLWSRPRNGTALSAPLRCDWVELGWVGLGCVCWVLCFQTVRLDDELHPTLPALCVCVCARLCMYDAVATELGVLLLVPCCVSVVSCGGWHRGARVLSRAHTAACPACRTRQPCSHTCVSCAFSPGSVAPNAHPRCRPASWTSFMHSSSSRAVHEVPLPSRNPPAQTPSPP